MVYCEENKNISQSKELELVLCSNAQCYLKEN